MRSLLRNVWINILGFVGGKLAAAVTGILLLRALHPNAAGIYAAALGFAALFQSLADLGLGACLTRQVGAHPKQAGAWFSRGMQAQLAQTLAAALALTVFLLLGGAKGVDASLVALAFGIPALASIGSPVAAALQGLERFDLQGWAVVGASLLNATALALLLIFGQASPRTALTASLTAAMGGALLWIWTARKAALRWQPGTLGQVRALWRESLPFAAVSVTNQLYVRVDQALLVWMLGTGPLGFYLAAVRLVDLAVPVLGALNGPLYARLSGLHGKRKRAHQEDARRKLNLALRAMSALCLPLGVGGSLLALPLIMLVFGADYAPAAPALAALAWVPTLIGIHSNLLHGLNAAGHTRRLARLFAVNLGLNIALNLCLVPFYGILASALVSALCEAVNLAAAWWLARQAGLAPSLRAAFWPSLPAALMMGALVWALRAPLIGHAGLAMAALPLIALGALAYGILLLLLGFVGAEEKALFQRLRGQA